MGWCSRDAQSGLRALGLYAAVRAVTLSNHKCKPAEGTSYADKVTDKRSPAP